jgi:enterochelin esterase family protein
MTTTPSLRPAPIPGGGRAALIGACLLALSGAVPLDAAAAASAAVSKEGDGDFIIGPDYTPDPANAPKDGVPKGTTQNFELKSSDSKVYPGLKGAYTRRVVVYIPKQYVAGAPAPFIVVQDGPGYVHRVSTVLDNLIYERRVPVMIAVFVDNGGGDSKGSERGLEYDTVSERYSQFIETEVLPKVATDYKIAFTKDPEGRATMGGSSGAACAFTMAWFRPDLYHRVLSYSGTFVAQESPDNPASPHGAWEYHEHFIPMSPPKPLRIYLEVGENDNGAGRPENTYHNWPMANERMAAVLKAKGYHYRYEFAKKAGHVDGRVMDQTLPSAMEWLWRGYPIAK